MRRRGMMVSSRRSSRVTRCWRASETHRPREMTTAVGERGRRRRGGGGNGGGGGALMWGGGVFFGCLPYSFDHIPFRDGALVCVGGEGRGWPRGGIELRMLSYHSQQQQEEQQPLKALLAAPAPPPLSSSYLQRRSCAVALSLHVFVYHTQSTQCSRQHDGGLSLESRAMLRMGAEYVALR